MIQIVVNREEHETEEEILARFSLIDYHENENLLVKTGRDSSSLI
jgi:hypothetical protein